MDRGTIGNGEGELKEQRKGLESLILVVMAGQLLLVKEGTSHAKIEPQ
jgi:hypothetical protein